MTHLLEANLPHDLLQLLSESESGQSPLAAALRLLLNEAMKVEREVVLGAKPYERAQTRTGYANGFERDWYRPAGPPECAGSECLFE